MSKKSLTIREMTLKERAKATSLLSFNVILLTGLLVFFTNISGGALLDVFTGADTVDYSWRDVLAILSLPIIGYFDLLLFVPLTSSLAQLWYKLIGIINGYSILAVFLAIALTLYISFVSLSDYQSCGLDIPFSNIHYVKGLKMCEQFEYHPENEGSNSTSSSDPSTDGK